MRFFEEKKYKKFKMTNCAVMIYGICSKCQARIAREKRKQVKLEEKKLLLAYKKETEQKRKAEQRKAELKRIADPKQQDKSIKKITE